MKMARNETKKSEVPVPEPIQVLIRNHTPYQFVGFGGRSFRNNDNLLVLEIHIGEPGQQLKLIDDEWGDKIVVNKGIIPRPVA